MTDTLTELITIDPAILATDRNVRKDPNLTPEFVDSIRTHGVRVPVSVYWHPALSGYQVEDGQRRVLAAVEAGLPSIRAFVIDPPTDDADRIVAQLVVNEHRSPISPGEDADAIADLALFGVSATMIAKRTGRKMKAVSAAVKVAGSAVASAAIKEHQISIEDAFILTEFEGDAEAMADLLEVLDDRPAQLPHVAQRLRNERAVEAERQVIRDQIVAAGITLIDPPSYDSADVRSVAALTTDEARRTWLTDEIAIAEAGDDLRGFVRTINGEWDPETSRWGADTYVIGYAVANWQAHGWFGSSSTPTKGPLTDEDKAARAAARQNTKLWTAATTVRLGYVRELLKRRGLPSDYVALPALWFASSKGDSPYRSTKIITQLLDLDDVSFKNNTIEKLLADSPGQAPHIMLAIGVGCLEASWDEKKGWATDDLKLPLYLRQLKSWGYTLSDIEDTIVNPPAVTLIDSITSERAS